VGRFVGSDLSLFPVPALLLLLSWFPELLTLHLLSSSCTVVAAIEYHTPRYPCRIFADTADLT